MVVATSMKCSRISSVIYVLIDSSLFGKCMSFGDVAGVGHGMVRTFWGSDKGDHESHTRRRMGMINVQQNVPCYSRMRSSFGVSKWSDVISSRCPQG